MSTEDLMKAVSGNIDIRAREAAAEIDSLIAERRATNVEIAAIIERYCFSAPAESVDHAALRSELDAIRKRLNQFHAEYERPIVVKDLKRLMEICDLLLPAHNVSEGRK